MPKISIITVCRNAESTIDRTLRSVSEQVHLPLGMIEHIVVDGASNDSTLEIVKLYPHATWSSQKDKGIADAFNRGISQAKGEWIQILNADDALAGPTVLADLLPYLDANYDFVHGRTAIMDENLKTCLHLMGSEKGWQHLGLRMTVPHPALFAHRRMFEKFGSFDTSYRIAMDYEWILRSFGHARFRFVPLTISLFRSGGASAGRFDLTQPLECLRAKRKNSVGNIFSRNGWFLYQTLRNLGDRPLSRFVLFRKLIGAVRRPH